MALTFNNTTEALKAVDNKVQALQHLRGVIAQGKIGSVAERILASALDNEPVLLPHRWRDRGRGFLRQLIGQDPGNTKRPDETIEDLKPAELEAVKEHWSLLSKLEAKYVSEEAGIALIARAYQVRQHHRQPPRTYHREEPHVRRLHWQSLLVRHPPAPLRPRLLQRMRNLPLRRFFQERSQLPSQVLLITHRSREPGTTPFRQAEPNRALPPPQTRAREHQPHGLLQRRLQRLHPAHQHLRPSPSILREMQDLHLRDVQGSRSRG
jgi:hypothetical protein